MTAERRQDREAFAALSVETRELVDRVYRDQIAADMLEAYREGYESGRTDGVAMERERVQAYLTRDPAACIGCITSIMVHSIPGYESTSPIVPESDTQVPSPLT